MYLPDSFKASTITSLILLRNSSENVVVSYVIPTDESSIRSFWIWGDDQRHVSLVTLVANIYGTVR